MSKDAMGRVQQIEVLRIASELSNWKVLLLNLLECYCKEVFNEVRANDYDNSDENGRNRIIESVGQTKRLDEWLLKKCENDRGTFNSLIEAFNSLHSKQILRNNGRQHESLQKRAVVTRAAAFTDFGWKLAVHLYSATDDIKN